MPGNQEWKLLQIDDDEEDYFITKSIVRQFKGRKAKLEWAPDYESGIKKLRSSIYDAVLVDYNLGARTGIELIRECDNVDYPGALILYTGHGSNEIDLEAMQAGATYYIVKAEVTPLLLERSIRYAIERKQMERELRGSNYGLTAEPAKQEQSLLKLRTALEEKGSLPGKQIDSHLLASFPLQNPNPVIGLDFTCKVIFANPATFRILNDLGMDPDDVQVFLPPNIASLVENAHGSTTDCEVTVKDRVYREIIHHPPESQTVYLYAYEITRQKLAEQALRISEERFRVTLQDMPIVVANIDRNLCYTWVYNPLLGFREEDIIGKTIGIATDAETQEKIHNLLHDVIDRGLPTKWEDSIPSTDGDRFFQTYAEPLFGADNEISGASIVSIDVTERRRTEIALQESESKFSIIFEKSAFAAALSEHPSTILVDVNQAWIELFGYTRKEALGRTSHELNINPDEQIRARLQAQLVEMGCVRGLEMPLYNKAGEQIFVSLNIDLVDINGKPYILSTIQNITQRKQVEQALSEQNERLEHFTEELQRSNQALEDFAFVASHDLQEPLRKIHSYGNILKSHSLSHLDDDGQLYLDRMIHTTERMQSMLNGLLAYSRVTTEGTPFVRVDLTQTAFDALTDLEIRVKQTLGQVEIGELPTVEADGLQMRQLFQNLIGNALKFHRLGIPPHVTVLGEIRPEGEAIVTIKDNGIGFDEQFSNQLFKPFRRLHGKSEFEGSGVGLAICKKIMDRHNGIISVRSTPGEGTTFTLRLPTTAS